jgi:hypothetical protein
VARADTVRSLITRIHAAGGCVLAEEAPGSGLISWSIRLGRWPFEVQVDRYALELRCYLADDLFCTGRISEDEVDVLMGKAAGGGDPSAALEELRAFVDAEVKGDTRRFMIPPHAERHPDRRDDRRMDATTAQKPGPTVDRPS